MRRTQGCLLGLTVAVFPALAGEASYPLLRSTEKRASALWLLLPPLLDTALSIEADLNGAM